jgi:chemotaxis protein methyltransferase CheR
MELITPNGTEQLIRDLVHERTGMLYADEKNNLLLEKLSPLVIERGFQSFLDYYYLLKYDSDAEKEWKSVVNAISVQETYFWREMDQVRALVDILIPEWLKSSDKEPLRVWSAACATGEEPLSIAMALNEARWYNRFPIEIDATDVSEGAIAKAKEGLYRERSFRNLPMPLREKYFRKEEHGWRIDPRIHSRINWHTANLVNRVEIAPYAHRPFIFCRNAFIYFSNEMIRRVVKTFADYANIGAYLFVGVSESLLQTTNDFELIDVGDAFVYKLVRKRGLSGSLREQGSATAGKLL